MSDPLQLLPTTLERLQKYARPFIDTVDSVVNRILDEYEGKSRLTHESEHLGTDTRDVREFDPASPPRLTHTKLLSVKFNNTTFDRSETNWNALVNAAIRVARKNIRSEEALRRVVIANFVFGRKEEEGYRYLPDIELSVQGQDANAAWRTVFQIAKYFDIPFEIVFVWRSKDEAQHPGVVGQFKRSKFRRL